MAERQLRFLAGVTGHDVTKIRTRCLKCGGIRQPSADAGAQVPAPPDLVAALRAARTAPSEPKRLSPLLTPPAPPTVSHLEALSASETVPSPAFEALRDSIVAFRDGLTKKWRR